MHDEDIAALQRAVVRDGSAALLRRLARRVEGCAALLNSSGKPVLFFPDCPSEVLHDAAEEIMRVVAGDLTAASVGGPSWWARVASAPGGRGVLTLVGGTGPLPTYFRGYGPLTPVRFLRDKGPIPRRLRAPRRRQVRGTVNIARMEPIPVDLSGVPETLLWNLGRRAAAARTDASLLEDPLAIEVAGRLQYDFTDASRGARWHAVRVATFDDAVRRFLNQHPAGTVVALGEGLETQFWRLDNGRMRWLSVDLPAALDLRRRVMPEDPRQRSYSGSALSPGWLDQLDPAAPVLVTAQGLLVYFQRNEVHELIAAIAGRLPGSLFVFDVVPEKMLEMVKRMRGRERDQAVGMWTWLFNSKERVAISQIPGVAGIRDLVPPRAPGMVPLTLRAVRRLPRRVRYALPVLPVLQMRFR